MSSHKTKLLSSTVMPLVLGASLAAGGAMAATSDSQDLTNPTAVAKPASDLIRLAACKACNPCNPCAAKKACNPCNPCAAKKACNPCNPCAAKKACNPCNPCNPCAAKKK